MRTKKKKKKKCSAFFPPTPHLNGGRGKTRNSIQMPRFTSVKLFLYIEAKINVGQPLRKGVFCPKTKPASGYCTAVGIVSKPTYSSYLQKRSCPLAVKATFLVADVHLYHSGREGSVASVFQFLVSSWRAYKWFSCIKIKCIWPIGSIYTITVSKNFRNFSHLKGLKSSTADNWRLCPSFLSL